MADLPDHGSLSLYETARHVDRFASGKGPGIEAVVPDLHRHAAARDALPRDLAEWRSRQARSMAARGGRMWPAGDPGICANSKSRPRGGEERVNRTLEQWAGRRSDQPVEDSQASNVWPGRRRIAPRTPRAVLVAEWHGK